MTVRRYRAKTRVSTNCRKAFLGENKKHAVEVHNEGSALIVDCLEEMVLPLTVGKSAKPAKTPSVPFGKMRQTRNFSLSLVMLSFSAASEKVREGFLGRSNIQDR